MPTLMEALQPQLGPTTALPQPQLGQTKGLRQLVQTMSGKEQQPGAAGPQQADVGELQAARETRLQGQQQALSEQINTAGTAQKSEGLTQAAEQQAATLGEKVKDNQSQFEIRANSIISDFTNNQRKIETGRDIMALEQAGAAIRLGNEKYVAELQRQGDLSRLSNQANFKEQAFRDELTTGMILAKDDVTFKQMLNADDRTFQWALGQMDIDFALDVAAQANAQANAQAMFQGVGSVLSAGSQAAADWFKATPAPDTTGKTSSHAK